MLEEALEIYRHGFRPSAHLDQPYAITDGHATVTDAPGWGVTINPEWLAGAQYQITSLD